MAPSTASRGPGAGLEGVDRARVECPIERTQCDDSAFALPDYEQAQKAASHQQLLGKGREGSGGQQTHAELALRPGS